MKILTISTSSQTTYFLFSTIESRPNQNTKIQDIYKQVKIINTVTDNNYSVVENIGQLYKKTVKNNNPEFLIIDKGPGSFTGIRTAVTFAKGLTIGTETALRTVSILDSLALQKQFNSENIKSTAQIDARNGNVYSTTLKFNTFPEPKSRNQIIFKKSKKFDSITEETMKFLTILGIYDLAQYGTEIAENILPLYGNPVNITKPKK